MLEASIDLNGRLTDVAPAWQTLLGWHLSRLKQSAFIEWVHPDDLDAVLGGIQQLYGNGGSSAFVCRIMRMDGHYVQYAWHATQQTESLAIDLRGNPMSAA